MKSLIKSLTLTELSDFLGFSEKLELNNTKSLHQWKMELDDQPIFRYLYRNFRPKRHLEFGTWQGAGVIYCVEECDATVWTINIPFGEFKNGKKVYGLYKDEINHVHEWVQKIGLEKKDDYVTDSFGFIGRYYLEKEYGHRVCQIYCDSKNWDTKNYPKGFFDSVLIDGNHNMDYVINDTFKSLPLLRNKGLMMWHDYCPPVYADFECVKNVIDAINYMSYDLSMYFKELIWINKSWILIGIKDER